MRRAVGPTGAAPIRQAAAVADRTDRRVRCADLSGMTVGTWRILYEEQVGNRRHCMCRCVACGVKKIITTVKFRQGYALRCPECRFRRQASQAGATMPYGLSRGAESPIWPGR